MAAVLLALLAAAAFGALAVAIRVGFRRGGDADLTPFVIALIGAAGATVVASASGALSGVPLADLWPFAAIGAVVPGISQILYVRAIRDAGPSRASIVIGVAPLISAALAIVFLEEPFGPVLALATVLIVIGAIVLAWEPVRPPGFRAIGLAFALACAGLFAGRDNLVRASSRDTEVPPLAATMASLAGAAVILGLIVVVRRRGPAPWSGFRRTAIAFLPAGVALGVAYGALIEAFDRGSVTVVAPLNATQSFFAVAFSAVLLGRREAIGWRVVLASILIVAGGVLIGATR